MFVENSPPDLICFRFFKAIWPGMKPMAIYRHPPAVAYATQKWCKRDIFSILDHTLTAYEIFRSDKPYLDEVLELKYETFVARPRQVLNSIFSYLELDAHEPELNVRENINQKYFSRLRDDLQTFSAMKLLKNGAPHSLEIRANRFGYS